MDVVRSKKGIPGGMMAAHWDFSQWRRFLSMQRGFEYADILQITSRLSTSGFPKIWA